MHHATHHAATRIHATDDRGRRGAPKPSLMTPTDAFSPDYATARRRFRRAAERLGWTLEAHPIGGTGPGGDPLTVEVAISPQEPRGFADRLLVVSSGLHGVEGFFGSAVQLALLESWAAKGAPPVRCVMLHALNPFGFAWLRRVNEHNVDPNRNFLLPGERYAGAPTGYAALDGLLNPARPPGRRDPFTLRALLAVARYGMPALKEIIATGQYEFPQGLFYGGSEPSPTHALLAAQLPRWLGGSPTVVHLDLHTGLGAHAKGRLLIDYPLDPHQRDRLDRWFAAGKYEDEAARRSSYIARGGFGPWCLARGLAPDYLFAYAEYGSYGPLQVVAGLRAENQAHHWGSPGATSTLRAKQRLMELFCPASETWRTQVLADCVEQVERAARGLTSEV
jgi:hypothetical protein